MLYAVTWEVPPREEHSFIEVPRSHVSTLLLQTTRPKSKSFVLEGPRYGPNVESFDSQSVL